MTSHWIFQVFPPSPSSRLCRHAISIKLALHQAFLSRRAATERVGSFFASQSASTEGSKQRCPPIINEGIWRFCAKRSIEKGDLPRRLATSRALRRPSADFRATRMLNICDPLDFRLSTERSALEVRVTFKWIVRQFH